MTPCNHNSGCQLPGTVHVFDPEGTLVEIFCRFHAVATAKALCDRFTYVDAGTGQPYIRVTVEVILN